MSFPEYILDGKLCALVRTRRQAHGNRAHGYYNVVVVRFVDDNELERTMPAGKFNSAAKRTGRRLYWNGRALVVSEAQS